MERPSTGRSRVHFNASSNDEDEPTVNVTSFDPDPDHEEGKSIDESMEDDFSKDITEVKPPTSSFYFEESDSEDESKEIRSPQEKQQIHRFLRFKSPSAPTSPQQSPAPSPNTYSQHRDSDIPLLELNGRRTDQADSRRSSTNTNTEREKERKSSDLVTPGKKEAERLVREHTRRSRPKEFFRRLSSGDGLGMRSGAWTPDEDGDSRHHAFNSGVLTNLLKLYSIVSSMLIHTRYNEQPSTSSGNTPPSASGRTTPKWYSKSPNNSTTSLSALMASSTRAAAVPGFAASDSMSMNSSHSGGRNLAHAFKSLHHKSKIDEQWRLAANRIADVLQRQRFILSRPVKDRTLIIGIYVVH